MKILSNSSAQFIRANDVKIPEYFNRRIFTNKSDLDLLFGGSGIVPNFTFTLAAAPGTGKTTFLLQTLELLERNRKKTAYISGEETIEQLAFTSKRLRVYNVPLANITDVDDICDLIVKNKFNFVVIDSLPALTTKQRLNKNQREEYITTKLLTTAKANEIVIGIILHFTKTGSYKGSTLLPHSVDCNMIMKKNEDAHELRDIETTKNRFGSCSFISFPLTTNGFMFESAKLNKDSSTKRPTTSKKDNIFLLLETPQTIIDIVKETKISANYVTMLLRDLLIEGKIIKKGKGVFAIYEKI
jgi:predicted ATP-dependent serine protease